MNDMLYYIVTATRQYSVGILSSTVQNTKRLPGYSIRVSNAPALPSSESDCYKDPKTVKPLPTVNENDCMRTARYVWIYQNNTLQSGDVCPMLEICEVQVFGKFEVMNAKKLEIG